jgi:hypothetical protein
MNRYLIAIATIILCAALCAGGMYLLADTPLTHVQIQRQILVGAIVGSVFAVRSLMQDGKKR